MKDGLRFVDSDMHVMEPPDLFDRYLDPKFKHRISVPVGSDGQPNRGPSGLIVIDGLPTSDMDLQQYRKRVRPAKTQSTQLLSGSRIFDTGRLDFAIERDYDPDARPCADRARQHGSPPLACDMPGVQQLDPRVLPAQPRSTEVRRDAAGAR